MFDSSRRVFIALCDKIGGQGVSEHTDVIGAKVGAIWVKILNAPDLLMWPEDIQRRGSMVPYRVIDNTLTGKCGGIAGKNIDIGNMLVFEIDDTVTLDDVSRWFDDNEYYYMAHTLPNWIDGEVGNVRVFVPCADAYTKYEFQDRRAALKRLFDFAQPECWKYGKDFHWPCYFVGDEYKAVTNIEDEDYFDYFDVLSLPAKATAATMRARAKLNEVDV